MASRTMIDVIGTALADCSGPMSGADGARAGSQNGRGPDATARISVNIVIYLIVRAQPAQRPRCATGAYGVPGEAIGHRERP